MPIYEYDCGRCNRYYEALVFKGEKAKCPYCGSNDGKKRISAPHGVVNGASAANNYGLKPNKRRK